MSDGWAAGAREREAALEALAKLAGPCGERNAPLAPYTSLRVGGPADLLVSPDSVDLLQRLLAAAAEAGVPRTIIGAGTNLLVADDGVRGLVIRIARPLGRVVFQDATVQVEAGASLPGLAAQCARRGLAGLEFAGGIPGTVGGAVVMNAGANQSNIGQTLQWVDAFSLAGEPRRFQAEELELRYRGSRFLREPWVVARALLALEPDDPERIRERMRAYLERRRRTQPLGTHNAGSIFKNPPGELRRPPPGSGGRQRVDGGRRARLHPPCQLHHQPGGARAADVWRLIRRMQQAVAEAYGIHLELEVRLVGWPVPEGVSAGVRLPD